MSAAAPTPEPPAPPTPAAGEGVTREELDELKKRLDEFAALADRLAQADTTAEEQRLERETREAAARVEQTATRIGLAPADVAEVRSWIREETKEAVREALDEVAEVRHSDDPAAQPPPASSLAELQDDPSRQPPPEPPPPAAPPPPAEEPPQQTHWFHRPLGGNKPAGDGKPE